MRYLFIAIVFLGACNHLQEHFKASSNASIPARTVDTGDPSLIFKNGFWYFGSDLFSGIMQEYFKGNTVKHRTAFLNGKEEGWQETFYEDGKLSEKRFYHNGEKDSVHTGWWPQGNKRFEYHFTNGVYNGDYKEWYETGELMKHIHYTNGADDWGKGWRQNGKLYMNFVVKDGRRYGLNNSNLCYTVKNGRGEFIASVEEPSK